MVNDSTLYNHVETIWNLFRYEHGGYAAANIASAKHDRMKILYFVPSCKQD